jgi:hypothetical protein
MPTKKKPSKFLEFTRTDPDNHQLIEFIIAEDLIQMVRYNGINCVEIKIKGEKKPYSIIKDAKNCYERLKDAISPTKIN